MILITGGAGFIGSHLCERLIKDHEIIVLDNLSTGSEENISHLYNHHNFVRFYQENILVSRFILENYKIDSIFHLAANSDISVSDPGIEFENTFKTTIVLLEQCRLYGIKEFHFTSSGSVYGEARDFVEETDPLNPISHYAAAKAASEMFMQSYCFNYNIKGFIYRLPNVIGTRMSHGVIYDFKKRLTENPKQLEVKGNGWQTKPYMLVDDVIDAMFHIWKLNNEGCNVFNIAPFDNTSVRNIAKIVCESMKLKAKIVYSDEDRGWQSDVPYYQPSIAKLIMAGYRPPLKSIDSLKKVIYGNIC